MLTTDQADPVTAEKRTIATDERLAMKRFLFAVTRGSDNPKSSNWVIHAPNRDVAERALIEQIAIPDYHRPAASLDGFNAANSSDYKLSRLRAPTEFQVSLVS